MENAFRLRHPPRNHCRIKPNDLIFRMHISARQIAIEHGAARKTELHDEYADLQTLIRVHRRPEFIAPPRQESRQESRCAP